MLSAPINSPLEYSQALTDLDLISLGSQTQHAEAEAEIELYWLPMGNPDAKITLSSIEQLAVIVSALAVDEFGYVRRVSSYCFAQIVAVHKKQTDQKLWVVETFDGIETFMKRIYRGEIGSYPEPDERPSKTLFLDTELFSPMQASEISWKWMHKLELPENHHRTERHYYLKGDSYYTYPE